VPVGRKLEIKYEHGWLNISYCYEEKGEETLFFTHGLGCCKDSFGGVWKAQGYHGYSIFTFDLPGFGDSSKPTSFSYDMKDYAGVVDRIIKALNLKNLHLIGHSMGGAIALFYLDAASNNALSFINLEGNLCSQDCTLSRQAANVPGKEFESSIFDQIKEEMRTSEHKGLRDYHECLLKSSPYAFYQSSCSLVKYSDSGILLKRFLRLPVKSYYVFGGKNKDREIIKTLNEHNLNLASVPESGHFMMNDNPKAFYTILLSLLQNH
jgi:pimeloyl-ACP methyl ester carboxylesterase